MSWKDKLHDAIMEPDPAKPVPHSPPPQPEHVYFTGTPSAVSLNPSSVAAIDTPSDGSAMYGKLLSKTDFSATPIGQTLNKYLEPLAELQMDDRTKIKAAVAQAKKQEGLTADKVLATFDQLLDRLNVEDSNICHAIDTAKQNEIVARQAKVDGIKKQIDDLQQQLVTISGDMITAQGKLDHAVGDLQVALQRRAAELNAEREHYQQALQ
jgi:hypothetical protein